MGDKENVNDTSRLELYKLEYEQCVSSYHNIYEEIWKIFSYLTAIAAALLVFGRENFTAGVAVSISMLPLVFWFLGVYLPMDRYGRMRSERLAELEEKLNKDYHANLGHFIILRGRTSWGVSHKYGFGWRVKTAVCILGFSVILTCVGSLCYAICTKQLSKSPTATRFVGEVEVKKPIQLDLKERALNPTIEEPVKK